MSNDLPTILRQLHWLGHDSFRLDGPPVIYLDPWRLPKESPQADLILVSHEHSDHCSPEDIELIRGEHTVVVSDTSSAAKLAQPLTILRPGESTAIGDIEVSAIPAYNIDKQFHPKEALHVGYILTIAGESLYFAGDTDHIPEMSGLKCDVALLPVSGVYVMTAEEAVQAAGAIAPKVAVPMHYASGVAGTMEDAEHFRDHCDMPVVILPSEGAPLE
jgi:L-ascorbate metabolism protein UlaG (beta-lactamase superfamily)